MGNNTVKTYKILKLLLILLTFWIIFQTIGYGLNIAGVRQCGRFTSNLCERGKE